MSTARHPLPAPASCSAASVRLDEPLAGTGPQAVAWLAIEQPGPWGRKALTESHLDPDLGRELDRRAQPAGVRIALIRRPGRHALAQPDGDADADTDTNPTSASTSAPAPTSAPTSAPRRILLADTTPGRAALRSLTITDPHALLDLDFAALAAGDWTAGGLLSAAVPEPQPVILVCTNGKRDRCCALLGRALTLDLVELAATTAAMSDPAATSMSTSTATSTAGTPGVDVWECDHLGGHRFAPTALVLPTGYTYGRLDAVGAAEAVEAARHGQMAIHRCRGRSTWNQRGQAAELALRDELQEFAADAVLVTGERPAPDGVWNVELTAHEDVYRVSVAQRAAEKPRPESCGKAFGTPIELDVLGMEKLG